MRAARGLRLDVPCPKRRRLDSALLLEHRQIEPIHALNRDDLPVVGRSRTQRATYLKFGREGSDDPDIVEARDSKGRRPNGHPWSPTPAPSSPPNCRERSVGLGTPIKDPKCDRDPPERAIARTGPVDQDSVRRMRGRRRS
jgi:hypothetical protein